MASSNLTVDSILESTCHDRERRVERQIDKITLLEARRYGMAEKQSKGRIKYIYAGHEFIYDPKKNKAITSYKVDPNKPYGFRGKEDSTIECKRKKKKEPSSGTRFYKPVLIQMSADHNSAAFKMSHDQMAVEVYERKEKWTSHTVMVVDMSGSMRDDDVDGARCRADGVWTTLARDFVKKQLEDEACSIYDVVSVIVMRKSAQVVVHCEPMTYVLYNKLVTFRDWDNMRPQGHGFYKPALKKAEELLKMNSNGSCSLSLMFFSDGKPSDHMNTDKLEKEFCWKDYGAANKELVQLLGSIGSRFGRRLNVMCVGMAGQQEEDFSTLRRMADEAKAYGAQAVFNRPNLNVESLSAIVTSSVASSLASKTEMTSLKTGKVRSVRTDIERERLNAPDDKKVNSDWRVFRSCSGDSYVQNVWKWNYKSGDFARIIDPRCNHCYRDVASCDDDYTVTPGMGAICRRCSACYFCARCRSIGGVGPHYNSGQCKEFARDRRSGFLVKRSGCPLGYSVAWKKKAFGEGAERLAFKFRFLGPKDKFVGPVMVAKESRFLEDLHESGKDYLRSHRHAYHRSFMRTQATAAKFAKIFNMKIAEIEEIPNGTAPKIEFVKPAIFELEDQTSGTTYNVLVEPLIQGKYKKYTDNLGGQAGITKRDFATENAGVDLISAAALLGRTYTVPPSVDLCGEVTKEAGVPGGLDIIAEGSGDEDSEDEDSTSVASFRHGYVDVSTISDEEYLQAFSHFTYVFSGAKLMVVDLQGALQTAHDGQRTFLLTDPAIHHRRKCNDRTRQYGRTDLGRKGMRAFFKTHTCNSICHLFNFREKKMQKPLDGLSSRERATPPSRPARPPATVSY